MLVLPIITFLVSRMDPASWQVLNTYILCPNELTEVFLCIKHGASCWGYMYAYDPVASLQEHKV